MSPSHLRRSGFAAAAALALSLTPLAATAAVPAQAPGAPFVAQSQQSEAEGPVLRIAITADFETFNPFTTIYAAPININRLQFEQLAEVGPDNTYVPGFAESWEVSDDGRVWTYTIPEGRVWSDGEPATAQDAAWTIQQVKDDPELGSANGSAMEGVESIEATDDKTLVITLTEGQATNPGASIPIVPKHVWENLDDAGSYMAEINEPVVGSGPYQIQNYAKGQFVELKANPNFWRGTPPLAGITYTYYRNTDAAVQGLRAGEVDLVSGLTVAQFDSLEGQADIATHAGKGRRYSGIGINPGAIDAEGNPMGNGNPVLHDPQVRRAITTAIDADTLIERVLGGYAEKGVTQIPDVYAQFFGLPEGHEERQFSLEEANAILDEAGYTERNADGIRLDKEGNPIELRLMSRDTASEQAQMAQFIQEWMKEIGIAIRVETSSSAQLSAESALANYDMYFTGWGLGPDPDYQLSINTCASRPNADGSGAASENHWCSPEFDALYEQQRVELDEEKRAELVKEAFALIYDADVIDVLYYQNSLEAWRTDKVTSFGLQPSDGGVIYGQSSYWAMYDLELADGVDGQSADGGSNTALWVGGGALLLALIGGGVLLARKKSGAADDKE